MKKKTLAIILAVVVLVSVITTGTIAWLTAKTPPITNTFAPSNIGLVLQETKGSPTNADGTKRDFKMVPGMDIPKDPVVTVTANSEACYVFVKITENLGAWSNSGKTFSELLNYATADGWIALGSSEPGVYYRTVNSSTANQTFPVLVDNQITVSYQNVTKELLDKLYAEGAVYPTLTFTAYAIQSANLTDSNADSKVDAADAWALLNTP